MENKSIQTAKRGMIYDFYESDLHTIKNKVLVVSSEKRCEDNIISVIMLGTKYTGYDCVPIKVQDQELYARCGLVTYTKRSRLGDPCWLIDADLMERIDMNIINNLGLGYLTEYKQKYEALLELTKADKE